MAAYLEDAQADAAEAQALRETLVAENLRVAEFQSMLEQAVDHAEILERVSRLTPGEVYLQSYNLQGQRLRLNGFALNAGAYMQLLRDEAGFAEVQTQSAFNRDRRTGLERFALDIRLVAKAGEGTP